MQALSFENLTWVTGEHTLYNVSEYLKTFKTFNFKWLPEYLGKSCK